MMKTNKIYNTPKNKLIAHFMRVNWIAVKNVQGSGHTAMSRTFKTEQAAQNVCDKDNRYVKNEASKWLAAPQWSGFGYEKFVLRYNVSWSALMKVAIYISKMKAKLPITLQFAKKQVMDMQIKEMSLNSVYKNVYAFVELYMKYKENGYK